jgi:hypothetical protein
VFADLFLQGKQPRFQRGLGNIPPGHIPDDFASEMFRGNFQDQPRLHPSFLKFAESAENAGIDHRGILVEESQGPLPPACLSMRRFIEVETQILPFDHAVQGTAGRILDGDSGQGLVKNQTPLDQRIKNILLPAHTFPSPLESSVACRIKVQTYARLFIRQFLHFSDFALYG